MNRWALLCIIVILVVAPFVAGYYIHGMIFAPSTGSILEIVCAGDNVFVDYIGFFENGKVFDTSLASVAVDNITYPKSISFELKSLSSYKPINFTAGGTQMIAGFSNGVIGMKRGETRYIFVPPELGYGNQNPALIKNVSRVITIPLTETLNASAFKKKYDTEPITGMLVTDPTWGWDTHVRVIGESIKVTHCPVLNNPTPKTPYPWKCKVIEIDSSANPEGIIRIEHQVYPSDANQIKGSDASGTYILTNVTESTLTLNYNKEVVGKNLIFRITITGIIKPR